MLSSKPGDIIIEQTRKLLEKIIITKILHHYQLENENNPDFENDEMFQITLKRPIRITTQAEDPEGGTYPENRTISELKMDCALTVFYVDEYEQEFQTKDITLEESAAVLNELERMIFEKTLKKQNRRWGIYNKRGERLYQYGEYEYEDMAMSALRRVLERNPESGAKLRIIDN